MIAALRQGGSEMNTRFIDWIWNVRGSVSLAPGQSPREVFDRLDPLFHEYGTTYTRSDDTLVFEKKDQPAQDKMSVFDRGVLTIDDGAQGPVLKYRLSSRILLFCFLAPLLFLAFGQLSVAVANWEEARMTPAEKAKIEKKEAARKDKVLPQHPIDKFLGAPAPDAPKKDEKKRDGEKDEKKKPKGLSPTPAYVFAGIFAFLYLVGRVLEDRLVLRLFRRRLEQDALVS